MGTKTSDEEHQFTKPMAVLVNGTVPALRKCSGSGADRGLDRDRTPELSERDRTDAFSLDERFLLKSLRRQLYFPPLEWRNIHEGISRALQCI